MNKKIVSVLVIIAAIAALIYTYRANNESQAQSSASQNAQSLDTLFEFTATPSTVRKGQSSVLSWRTPANTSCELKRGEPNGEYEGIADSLPAVGTYTVTPQESESYWIMCSPGGGDLSDSRIKQLSIAVQ